MVDPTDKDTEHIRDQITGSEGYTEYTKDKKGKVNQLDVGNEKDQHISGSYKNNTYASHNAKRHWFPVIFAAPPFLEL